MPVQNSKYDYTPIGPLAATITKYLGQRKFTFGFNRIEIPHDALISIRQ